MFLYRLLIYYPRIIKAFYLLDTGGNSSDQDEDDTGDINKECERARGNTNRDKLQWQFYSANDDDYKIASQDQESDDSQTPIAEEKEPPSNVSQSESAESRPVVIKPVQDLVSPVLASLEELEDTVLYSISETKDSDHWEREKQMKPEIQSSSIWKPMTSPMGDPNAQLNNESDDPRNDAKRLETPVDLSTREKFQTRRRTETANWTKPNALADANVGQSSLLNSSDDEIPDEESFSTLAAFCQAKVTALYGGMTPDEPTEKTVAFNHTKI